MKKNKGFTLIELVAVLVIMAIIALIVTPLVMSIIRKAKISADKRSVDAYGRSIELAIAGYLLDNGSFPTSIEQLTIEYSGEEVVCSTTQLKSDSSIYLAGCTVDGRSVEGYTYGKEETVTYDAYEVGDQVTYNNVDYYVIADSDANETSVTLLKKTPLTVAEVNQYGAEHVNKYGGDSPGTAFDNNGYGGMAYYTSETCGFINDEWVETGCTTDYELSEIKYVVDAWKAAQAPLATEARLIELDEIKNNLGYVLDTSATSEVYIPSASTPSWVYNSDFGYWISSQHNTSTSDGWCIWPDGELSRYVVSDDGPALAVRPVITLSKTNISS